ncbi:C-terminal binding protein [Bryobacter aggregatus]|uniref:C-terminal binding protein n=1 Tax=Bryobacter aggregatus TaxID=360054 RepID=UPI00068988F0|nr:C-terminal binding protein [Bryobacter aggregatus]
MSLLNCAIRLNATTFPLTPEEREVYQSAGFSLVEAEAPDLALFQKHAHAVALCIVSAKINENMIDHLPNLQVISRFGSGTDNIDAAAAARRGIRITNIPEFCLSEVADHTMALLLASARKLLTMDRATRQGRWLARIEERTHRIEGRQLGLIGFGRISQEVAKRARPFGLRIAAYDPQLNLEVAQEIGVQPMSLQELLSSSHFVSLHVPLLPATRHLMGQAQFESMRPDAIFINTARGAVVDEAALVAALEQQKIAGAAIDVYEGLDMFGPLPEAADHPLFHLPNVILSPHSAACSEESLGFLMRAGAQNAVDAVRERNLIQTEPCRH